MKGWLFFHNHLSQRHSPQFEALFLSTVEHIFSECKTDFLLAAQGLSSLVNTSRARQEKAGGRARSRLQGGTGRSERSGVLSLGVLCSGSVSAALEGFTRSETVPMVRFWCLFGV